MTQNAKKWAMLIGALAFHITGYLGVNAIMAGRGVSYNVGIPLDYQIPFIKYFSPIYSVVYIVPVISFFVLWKSYEGIKAGFKCFMGAGVVCLLFYVFFPVAFTERATLVPPYDFFENVVRFFYWVDKPYNCFPSLHVALAFISAQMVDKFRPRFSRIFYSYAILVSLSTLFIRQHYILDLVAGAGLAYGLGWFFIPKETGEESAMAEEAV